MKSLCMFILAALAASTRAFVPASQGNLPTSVSFTLRVKEISRTQEEFIPFGNDDEVGLLGSQNVPSPISNNAASVFGLISAAFPVAAGAAGPDWGLFEGRTGSLIHPVVMGGLFLYTMYTGFLGFQWRRQRTIGDEISKLKSQLPKEVGAAGSVAAAVSAAKEAGDDALALKLAAAASTETEIAAMQKERKELAASGPRDKHFSQGAFLSFLGTAIAIEGCLNTFGRAGKLFPGPHLYAGAALVVLWGLAVATVPAMQKGSETARNIHIGANLLGGGFFFWQVQSGIPILFKVIENTSWP